MVAFYEEKKNFLAFGSFVEPELSTAPVPQAENNGYSEAWFNSSKLVSCSHLIQKNGTQKFAREIFWLSGHLWLYFSQ